MTIHFQLEEPSIEAFLKGWLAVHAPDLTFVARVYAGNKSLTGSLVKRLRAYASLPAEDYVIVLLDRDAKDCRTLVQDLTALATGAGFRVRPAAGWRCAICLAIEELEAWYFGDWAAVQAAYPRVPNIRNKARFRSSDDIPQCSEEF